jgi:hypothetical protein
MGTTLRSRLMPYVYTLATAFAIFVIVGTYLAGRMDLPLPPSNPQVLFKHGTALGQRLTGRSWTADYQEIITNSDQTVMDLIDVRHAVIYKKGKPYLSLRCKRMTVNTLTRDFNATGALHVETISAKPRRAFDTSHATWNDLTQTLILPDKAVFDTGAPLPLLVGSATYDVKTGQIELRSVAGGLRLK